MARTATFKNKVVIAQTLQNVDQTSRFLKLQLVDQGFLAVEKVPHEGKGRPAHNFVLTGKARGLLAIAKNWGKKNANLMVFTKVPQEQVAA